MTQIRTMNKYMPKMVVVRPDVTNREVVIPRNAEYVKTETNITLGVMIISWLEPLGSE